MNKHLHAIQDFIQNSAGLNSEEKNEILKSLKAASDEHEIALFKLDRTEQVKRTTGILLEETIEELEQKRKAVEVQNREPEIEAALERVRARTMAMHESDELAETTSLMFKQLKSIIAIPDEARTFISLIDRQSNSSTVWMTQSGGEVRRGSHITPLNEHPLIKRVYDAWKRKEPYYIRDFSGQELADYKTYVSTLPHIQENKDRDLKKLLDSFQERIEFSEATFSDGLIVIMVSSMKSIFTTNASKMEIDDFFATANSGIKSMNLTRMMMEFTMVTINSHRFRLINAGMPPVYLYRNKQRSVQEIKEHGLPIGAMNNSNFKVTAESLNKGDVLLLLTDGMPELQNKKKELYGYKRLQECFSKAADKEPQEIVEQLKNTASQWVGDKDPEDDVTFVVIKVK